MSCRRTFGWFAAVIAVAAWLVPHGGAWASEGACGGWSIVGAPHPAQSSLQGASTLSPTDAWAVGWSGYRGLAEHWDGARWRTVRVKSPAGSAALFAVSAAASSDVWAVGSGGSLDGVLIERWDGSSWRVVRSVDPTGAADLFGVAAISSSDAWAVGGYLSPATGKSLPLAEHWDGTRWRLVDLPELVEGSLFAVTAVAPQDVWAVGDQISKAKGANHALALHWDGSNWSVVPVDDSALHASVLLGVAAAGGSSVWAVGDADQSGSPTHVTLVERWDGSTWSRQPSPSPGTGSSTLAGVTTVSSVDVWAVGDSVSNHVTTTLGEHWDGASWQVVATQNSGRGGDELFGVAATGPADVWSVGESFDPAVSSEAEIQHLC